MSGDLDMDDNDKIKLGTGDDLQIYHDGTSAYIKSEITGHFNIDVQYDLYIRKQDGTEPRAKFHNDGSVELYYDGSKKLNTHTDGVEILGKLYMADSKNIELGNSQDLKIYHDGTNNWIKSATGQLKLETVDSIQFFGNNSETLAQFSKDGAVQLYYDNSKKFETFANGIKLYDTQGDLIGEGFDGGFNFTSLVYVNELRLMDSEKIQLGDGLDLQIYHNGTENIIATNNSAVLQIRCNGTEKGIEVNPNGNVELYYNNSKKLETTAGGTIVTGTLNTTGTITGGGHIKTGSDSGYFLAGASNDLQIYHDGSDSYIKDSGTGKLRLLTDSFRVSNAADSENLIAGEENGAVSLFYDDSKKFETASYGTYVSGRSKADNFGVNDAGKYYAGAGDDLQIYHDGSESVIGNSTGTFQFLSPNEIRYRATTHHFLSYGNDETMAKFNDDGAVELYYNNSKKLETTSTGINIGVASPQYAKPVNIQGGNGATLSLSNQDYTGNDADTWSGIEGRIQCGNSIWATSGVAFKKANGTAGDKHTKLELYVTDGYSNQTGLIVNPDGEVTKPKQPSFLARAGASRNNVTGAVTFTSCDTAHNVSGSYDTSNSRFTAPIAGWYHFGGQAGYKETGDNFNIKFMVNGSYEYEPGRVIGGSNDDSWQSHSCAAWSQVVKLSANDYVEINTAYELHQNPTYSNFWGYLIK